MDQKKKYKGYLIIYLFIVTVSKKKKKNVYTYDSSGSTAAFSLSFRPN